MQTITYLSDVYADGSPMELRIWAPDDWDGVTPIKWMQFFHGHWTVGNLGSHNALPMAQRATDAGMVLVASTSKAAGYSWFDGSPPNNTHHLETQARVKQLYSGLTHYLPCIWGFSMGGGRVGMEMADSPQNYSCFGISAGTVDVINWHLAGTYIANEIGLHNSPLFRIATVPLYGRKCWLKWGLNDGNVEPIYGYNWVDELPPENLYQADFVAGVGHVDMFCRTETDKQAWVDWCLAESIRTTAFYDIAASVSGTSEAPDGVDAGVGEQTGTLGESLVNSGSHVDSGVSADTGLIPTMVGYGPFYDLAPYASATCDAPEAADAGVSLLEGDEPEAMLPGQVSRGTDGGISGDTGLVPIYPLVMFYNGQEVTAAQWGATTVTETFVIEVEGDYGYE